MKLVCFCLLLEASFTFTLPSIHRLIWRRCLVYVLPLRPMSVKFTSTTYLLPYCLVIKRPNNGPNGPSAQSLGPDFSGPAQNGPLGQCCGWPTCVEFVPCDIAVHIRNCGTTGELQDKRHAYDQVYDMSHLHGLFPLVDVHPDHQIPENKGRNLARKRCQHFPWIVCQCTPVCMEMFNLVFSIENLEALFYIF